MPLRVGKEVQALPRALRLIRSRTAGISGVLWGLLAAIAGADPITLTSRSDGFSLSGELQAFDGDYYRLLADYGPVTLSASEVICTGSACPQENETTGFAITAAHGPGAVMLPALLKAYGRARGLLVTRTDVDATHIQFAFGGEATGARRFPVTVRLAVSGEGFADLAVNASDLVLADRLVSVDEAAIARDAGLGDLTARGQERALAWDALTVVTSPRRDRKSVSPARVFDLWQTPGPDWRALGFDPAPLRLHGRAHGEDLGKLDPDAAPPKASVTWHERGADLAAVVREQPSGLGLVALSERGPAQALPLVGTCGLSHAPTRTAVALGTYPWTTPVMLYLPERRAPMDLHDFLAFLQTPEAAAVMRRAGFTLPQFAPVTTSLADRVFRALADAPADQLQVLSRLAARLVGAEQLGMAIFPGTTRRDFRALSDYGFGLLARAPAEAGAFVLVAHAESVAQAEADAAQLLVELAQARGDAPELVVEVAGVGRALPIACADMRGAETMNRRIDVWRIPATDILRREN